MFSKIRRKQIEWSATRVQSEPVKNGAPLVICSIFKNEAPFLAEWIEFHLKQGVQNFFLIDNFSSDNFEIILEPYLKNEIVILYKTQQKSISAFQQAEEFTRAIPIIQEKMGRNCWVAFLDLDEFLFDIEGTSVPEVLQKFDGQATAAILANWLMFGTSHIKKIDTQKPMIEQFTLRAKNEHNEHWVFKSICYLPNVFRFYGEPHKPIPKGKSKIKYSDGTLFQMDIKRKIHSPLRINHYWYRSEEYYFAKKIEKRKAFGYERPKHIEERHMKKCNEIEDRTILKILQ